MQMKFEFKQVLLMVFLLVLSSGATFCQNIMHENNRANGKMHDKIQIRSSNYYLNSHASILSLSNRILSEDVKENGAEIVDTYSSTKKMVLAFGKRMEIFQVLIDFGPTNFNGLRDGLEEINDAEMASILNSVIAVYEKKQYLFEKAHESLAIATYINEKVPEVKELNKKFMGARKETRNKLEQYLKTNFSKIFIDESGSAFPDSFTGERKIFDEDGLLIQSFDVVENVLVGYKKDYYPNGKVKSQLKYENGLPQYPTENFHDTGIPKRKLTVLENDDGTIDERFYANGVISLRVTPTENLEGSIEESFYENGKPKKLITWKHTNRDDPKNKYTAKKTKFGVYKEWHENGNLAVSGFYLSNSKKDGAWKEYFESGKLKLQFNYIDGRRHAITYWEDEKTQTLKDGTGTYEITSVSFGKPTRHFYKLKDGKWLLHEKYTEGVLRSKTEYNHEADSSTHFHYYDNGRLERKYTTIDGKSKDYEKFPKFDNPKIVPEITILNCGRCYKTRSQIPSHDPVLLNGTEVFDSSLFDVSKIRDPNSSRTTYQKFKVTVNKDGIPIDNKEHSGPYRELVKSLAPSLRFEPVKLDGNNASYFYIVSMKLILVEGS